MSFAVLVPSLAVLAPALAWVAPPEPPKPPVVALPQIRAMRAVKPPKIDGRLDDPAWPAAPVSDAFTQHYPDEGAPPTERTFVRVLYDDRNLYVGIDCWQTHSPIVRRLQRRDGFLPSDGVWIDIDSRDDGVSAYHFSVNAAGVLLDGIHYNDTNFSADWDAIWEAKVADTGHGYSVEFRIPLTSLRFTARPVQSWGFQVRRAIDARQETDDWAFFPRHGASFVHFFGRLDDLSGLPPPSLFEATPFVLGKLEHRAAGAQNVLSHGWFAGGSAGLGALAHLTNELTLDLAVNPDFGQVEADTVILNLSTFETFFPEKRPFFLEGLDVFATLRPVFYTRRIGRQPATPTLSTGEALVALPDPTRIWGAVKMSGTVGGRTTVGVLSALTGENDVDVQRPDGVRRARLAEPVTTYNVLRLKRLVAANADVGLLATATNRFDPVVPAGTVCPATLAAPTGGRCTNDAYVLSLDGRWRSRSGDYALAWQAIGSALSGGAPRAEPDGIPIQPGQPAGGASAYVAKEGGPHWLWSVWQHVTGRQLEFNDLGYLERKNDVNGSYTLSYRTLHAWWRTIETRTNLQLNLRETLDGLNLWRELLANTTVTLASFWSVTFEVHGRADYYDDREMGDGSALQRPGNVGALVSLATDPRKRVIGSLSGTVDRRSGGYHTDLHGQLTLRLLPQLQIDLLPTVGTDSGAPRYVGTDATPLIVGDVADYRFGVQTAVSAGATVRAAYTFTPQLSLQFYTQLFLAKVNYDGFYVYPKQSFRERVDLAALIPAAPPAASPDSEQATLNVNLVLRWEYRLGSTLFLVYTRAQTPALAVPGGGTGQLELAPIWRGRASDDVLMAKLAYWLG
ncbi:MAG TPA: DUF5916 domain-containing protein [Polyangia bacterium]|nr:DUF5916 domain-containing protein [Polyangia bacterium]